ncbi:MAG: methionine--tRNA ligase subunit beta [Candidatus Brocadiia bacterium]
MDEQKPLTSPDQQPQPVPMPVPQPAPVLPVPPAPELPISIDDFNKIRLVVAEVISCEIHPNADKLLVFKVSTGSGIRTVCAGIRKCYDPATLVGMKIVLVENLAPRMMRGVESQGMILAATSGENVVLVTTEKSVPAGSKVR